MSTTASASEHPIDLRLRAVSRLGVPSSLNASTHMPASASAAMGVLHALASSPATAADALALLHELQVHQIELELQAEELSHSHAELEAALARQIQLYDTTPMSCFTLARNTTLHGLNLHAATELGSEREGLLGQALNGWLTPASGQVLGEMLDRISAGSLHERAVLALLPREGAGLTVQASATADPAGPYFLLAWVPLTA